MRSRSALTEGSVRAWTAISAAVDIALGLLLAAGLSIATIVISLFGPTEPLVASFAWFLAASFVANGLLLLEVSSCEKQRHRLDRLATSPGVTG